MKNKILSNELEMNLQFFAEGDGAGDGSDAGDGDGTGAGDENGDAGDDDVAKGDDKPKSFDDILKDGKYQAEFDRRVQQSINTALINAQEKWKLLTDEKVSEADKLAKMTKEEKAAYQLQKQKKELSEREAAITRKELMAEAKNTLAEKKLPVSLSEVLNYSDADSCKNSIEAVEKAFQVAVEKAVEEKLKGGKPPKGATGNNTQLEEIMKMMG